MAPSTAVPLIFTRAVRTLRTAWTRPEITLKEISAPQRLAPFAYALHAWAHSGGEETADGRLILLHDPAGQSGWHGTLRLVTYVTAVVEADIATDPLLPAVCWSWLADALDDHQAQHRAIGGTVTQTFSTRFGDLIGDDPTSDVEIRASWTPGGSDLAPHVAAWCALLATTAGLPPPEPATRPGGIGLGAV